MEEEGQKEVENVTKSPKSGVTIAKKVANIVLDVIVVAVLLLALFTVIVTVNAKKGKDGTATIFGYQLRFVQSGSMEKCAYTDVSKYKVKSIKVKSCVFIKTAPTSEKEINEWYKTLKVGDVLTFQYNKNDGSAAPEDYEGDSKVITHRVIKIEKKENGNGYIITLKGDYKSGKGNEPAEQVIDTEVDTPAKTTYIIGKVTGQSYLLGLCVYVLKKPVGIVCVVIVPCLLMIVIQIFRIANVLGEDKKNKRKEEQANKDDEIEELKRQLAAFQNNKEPNRCKYCGAIIQDGETVCNNCGAKL